MSSLVNHAYIQYNNNKFTFITPHSHKFTKIACYVMQVYNNYTLGVLGHTYLIKTHTYPIYRHSYPIYIDTLTLYRYTLNLYIHTHLFYI